MSLFNLELDPYDILRSLLDLAPVSANTSLPGGILEPLLALKPPTPRAGSLELELASHVSLELECARATAGDVEVSVGEELELGGDGECELGE